MTNKELLEGLENLRNLTREDTKETLYKLLDTLEKHKGMTDKEYRELSVATLKCLVTMTLGGLLK